jgi:hypothetical protein
MEAIMSLTMQGGVEQQPELPPRVKEALIEACVRVRHQVAAQLWWDGLSVEEQNCLGGRFEDSWVALGTIGMWMRLHHCRSQPRAVLELERELGLIPDTRYRWLDRELERVDPFPKSDPEDQIEEARRHHRLVLARDGRWCLVYWDGERVAAAWEAHPKKWALLWKLAEAARRRSVVRWDELCRTPGDLANQKHRLIALLPRELVDLVGTVPGDGCAYRLELAAEEIRLLDFSSEGGLMLPD